jgi:hypothetical protein
VAGHRDQGAGAPSPASRGQAGHSRTRACWPSCRDHGKLASSASGSPSEHGGDSHAVLLARRDAPAMRHVSVRSRESMRIAARYDSYVRRAHLVVPI